MSRHSCLCLQCGRVFVLALEAGAEINNQKCPICGGKNLIEHDPRRFFDFFAGGGS